MKPNPSALLGLELADVVWRVLESRRGVPVVFSELGTVRFVIRIAVDGGDRGGHDDPLDGSCITRCLEHVLDAIDGRINEILLWVGRGQEERRRNVEDDLTSFSFRFVVSVFFFSVFFFWLGWTDLLRPRGSCWGC